MNSAQAEHHVTTPLARVEAERAFYQLHTHRRAVLPSFGGSKSFVTYRTLAANGFAESKMRLLRSEPQFFVDPPQNVQEL